MTRKTWITILIAGTAVLLMALGGEYLLLRHFQQPAAERPATTPATEATPVGAEPLETPTTAPQATPPVSLDPQTLAVSLGDMGPQLVDAGAIDLDRFVQLYEMSGTPLTPEQMAVLTDGSDQELVFSRESAHFLLNLFWALGLTNRNPVLMKGPMVTTGDGEVGRYASTGGWTIGRLTSVVLYSSRDLVALTPEQQARLEHVAHVVYRPCCNNPTDFPDCNHGMAMLGLLELMAANDSSEAEMFAAAKTANTFWFPGQTTEIALYMAKAQNTPWDAADPQVVVGADMASGSGFGSIHQWLASRSLLNLLPDGGDGCGL